MEESAPGTKHQRVRSYQPVTLGTLQPPTTSTTAWGHDQSTPVPSTTESHSTQLPSVKQTGKASGYSAYSGRACYSSALEEPTCRGSGRTSTQSTIATLTAKTKGIPFTAPRPSANDLLAGSNPTSGQRGGPSISAHHAAGEAASYVSA